MMLYAINKWRGMVTLHLWLFGLQVANDILNSTPQQGLQHITHRNIHRSGSTTKAVVFPYFWLSYVHAQQQAPIARELPKWQMESRVGVYLGPSSNHSRSIGLVLSPTMGHVSHQFHVRHNNFFETVSDKAMSFKLPMPEWMKLSGLVLPKQPSSEGGTRSSQGATLLHPIHSGTHASKQQDDTTPFPEQ